MAVIALVLSVVAVAFWLPGGNAACPSFNINYPPMRTLLCPGDNITYTCAFIPTTLTAVTWWSGSAFKCPSNNPVNTIQLTQQTSSGSPLITVPVSCGNLSAVMTNISGTCYTSVLTIPTPQYFNGTNVTCTDGSFGTLIGSDTLNIQLASPPPSAPTITVSRVLSTTFAVNFTVTFTSVPTATSYNVSVNDNTPISLPPDTTIIVTIDNNNITVSIPSTGAIFYVLNLINRINSSVYTVSVVAINCAGSSSPAKITGSAASSPSVSVLMSTNEPASTNLPSTNLPTTQSSSSNSDAVRIGVGVGVGIVVLLLLVAIAVVLVVFIVIKNKVSPATPKGDNNKRNEGDNKVPLPPKNTDKTPSKPEGLIYADIGLASRVTMQAPNPPDLSNVTYSSVQHVL